MTPVVQATGLLSSFCFRNRGAFCTALPKEVLPELTKRLASLTSFSYCFLLNDLPPFCRCFSNISRAVAPSNMSAMTEAELGQEVEKRSILMPEGKGRSRIKMRGDMGRSSAWVPPIIIIKQHKTMTTRRGILDGTAVVERFFIVMVPSFFFGKSMVSDPCRRVLDRWGSGSTNVDNNRQTTSTAVLLTPRSSC